MQRRTRSREPSHTAGARRARHRRVGTTLLALPLSGALLLASTPARAGAPTPATITYDLLVERPLGLVELVTGLGITTVAYPIAAAAGDGGLVVDHCVRKPGRTTFTRSLGKLEENRRSDCSPAAFGIELVQLSLGAAFQPLAWFFGGSPFGRGRPDDEGIEI